MFKFADWCYKKTPSHYIFWIMLWILWFSILWWLSSGTHEIKDGPKIPHLDKIAHFCYFMAGGFCFSNFLYLKQSINSSVSWKRIILVTFFVGAIVGISDEFHQTKIPGRMGNDLGDWCADIAGTLAGGFYCFFMWQRLQKSLHENVDHD